MKKELRELKDYTDEHLKYAQIIQRRNLEYQLSDESYKRLRGKLQEWLNHSMTKANFIIS